MEGLVVELFKKYGPIAILAMYFHSRLNTVEDQLIDCYKSQIAMSSDKAKKPSRKVIEQPVAIIPKNEYEIA